MLGLHDVDVQSLHRALLEGDGILSIVYNSNEGKVQTLIGSIVQLLQTVGVGVLHEGVIITLVVVVVIHINHNFAHITIETAGDLHVCHGTPGETGDSFAIVRIYSTVYPSPSPPSITSSQHYREEEKRNQGSVHLFIPFYEVCRCAKRRLSLVLVNKQREIIAVI